jgi:TonB family protein
MFVSSRYETDTSIQFKLPWDKNTARGFTIALAISLLFLWILNIFEWVPTNVRGYTIQSVPIELLNFGDGDGTGMSKGNLTREGESHKGKQPNSILEDAKIASETRYDKNTKIQDPDNAGNYIPKNQLSSDSKDKLSQSGSDNKNIGSQNGNPNGTGLGDKGYGKGKGLGFGDIEWGGGGNRTVLVKKVPTYPPGVNTSAQITIRFTVMPDGTISKMVPLQKADPRLEKAAMDALKQWRFNPLNRNVEMVGVIPITFQLR